MSYKKPRNQTAIHVCFNRFQLAVIKVKSSIDNWDQAVGVIQTYYVSRECNLSVTVKPKALGDNCFKTKRVGLTVTI